MKSLLTMIILFFFLTQSKAQDLIIKRSGEQMKVVITEINQDDIKYKDWLNQNGQVLSMLKTQIYKIKYSDGSEDLIGNLTGALKPLPSDNVTQKSTKSNEKVVENKEKISNRKDKTTILKPAKASEIPLNSFQPSAFTLLGANYFMSTVKGGPTGAGIQLGLGYRFSESLGVMLAVEPNYLLPPSGSSDAGVNIIGMAYPALVFKASKGIYLYGGFGLFGTYNSKISAPYKSFNSTTGYEGGIMVEVGGIGLKAGYLNATETGSKGSISIGLIKALKW